MTEAPDPQLQLKKRARRRLVGAVAFAGLAAVILPMVLDEEPKQAVQDVPIRIPGQEQLPYQPKDLAARAAAPAAAAVSGEPQKAMSPGGASQQSPVAVPPARPAAAPAAAPVVKPVEKSSDKAVAKPAEKVPEKAAEKKVVKPAEQGPEKTVDKKPVKLAENSPDKAAKTTKPVEKAIEKVPEKPVEKKVEKKVEKTADKPPEKAIEKMFEKPPEKAPVKKVDKPAEKTPETASEEASKSPADDHSHSAPAAGKPSEAAAAKSGGQRVILIGAFANADNARQLQSKISAAGVNSYTEILDSPDGKKTRVRAGPFPNREAAEKALEQLQKIGVTGVVAGRQ